MTVLFFSGESCCLWIQCHILLYQCCKSDLEIREWCSFWCCYDYKVCDHNHRTTMKYMQLDKLLFIYTIYHMLMFDISPRFHFFYLGKPLTHRRIFWSSSSIKWSNGAAQPHCWFNSLKSWLDSSPVRCNSCFSHCCSFSFSCTNGSDHPTTRPLTALYLHHPHFVKMLNIQFNDGSIFLRCWCTSPNNCVACFSFLSIYLCYRYDNFVVVYKLIWWQSVGGLPPIIGFEAWFNWMVNLN